MAERRGSGLSFGQLVTLTFGFLLASVLIFGFGLYVGYQSAAVRAARERDVARISVPTPEPVVAAPTALPSPVRVVAAATATVAKGAATATAVQVAAAATPTRPRMNWTTPTAGAAGGQAWTVQAYATNDTMRAVMLTRTLKSKGYDANTGTKQIGNVTWYVVRVGRFRDRAAAKALETKLRAEEGLEAASVTAQ